MAVILFEGSLTLKIDEIRGTEAVVRRLIGGDVILRVFKVDAGFKPGPGGTIISLIRKQEDTKENGQAPAGNRNGGKKS